jgi:TnpA family transposase
MQRVASSFRHGTVSASLLMRKLAAYPRQNQVARALTEFGKLERTTFLLEYFRDAALRRASCLHLLIAAIAAWNTIYLTEAFATPRRQGGEISEGTVAHIAPLGWEHINLIGKYQFAPQPGRSLKNLRSLRLKEEAAS